MTQTAIVAPLLPAEILGEVPDDWQHPIGVHRSVMPWAKLAAKARWLEHKVREVLQMRCFEAHIAMPAFKLGLQEAVGLDWTELEDHVQPIADYFWEMMPKEPLLEVKPADVPEWMRSLVCQWDYIPDCGCCPVDLSPFEKSQTDVGIAFGYGYTPRFEKLTAGEIILSADGTDWDLTGILAKLADHVRNDIARVKSGFCAEVFIGIRSNTDLPIMSCRMRTSVEQIVFAFRAQDRGAQYLADCQTATGTATASLKFQAQQAYAYPIPATEPAQPKPHPNRTMEWQHLAHLLHRDGWQLDHHGPLFYQTRFAASKTIGDDYYILEIVTFETHGLRVEAAIFRNPQGTTRTTGRGWTLTQPAPAAPQATISDRYNNTLLGEADAKLVFSHLKAICETEEMTGAKLSYTHTQLETG